MMNIVFLIAANLLKEIFRKKDIYVLVVMLIILMVYFSNVAFFGMQDIYRYMNEIGLGIVFLFSILIVVPFSAKLMSEEIKTKTIYPLLAKPVSRLHVILGKFAGSLLVSWSSFSIFFLMFSIISLLKHENGSLSLYLQTYVAAGLMLSFLSATAIFLSVYFTFSTAVTLSYAVFFLMSWFGSNLREILYKLPFVGQLIYYLLPHFEFFDLRHRLIHNWEALPFWVMLSIVLYAVIYTSALLLLAFRGFKKRWL